MSAADVKVFHARFVGVILATDMAKHMEDLQSFKSRLEKCGITSGQNNGHLFLEATEGTKKFDLQQDMLDFVQHAGDLSAATRGFATTKKWTYLLFEEFFH